MSEASVAHARVLQSEIQLTLSDDNRHYLERVLRLRPGDPFVVTDGAGREADAWLGNRGEYRREGWRYPGREPMVQIVLFLPLLKGERFEWALEKAVELGVATIVPVRTARCVVRDVSAARYERWRKVILAAMLQCGGCRLPRLERATTIAALPGCNEHSAKTRDNGSVAQEFAGLQVDVRHNRVCGLLLDAQGECLSEDGLSACLRATCADNDADAAPATSADSLVNAVPGVAPDAASTATSITAATAVTAAVTEAGAGVASNTDQNIGQNTGRMTNAHRLPVVAICSGPEGGFDATEIQTAIELGWRSWALGPRRLRADTAPLVAVSRLLSAVSRLAANCTGNA